MLHAHLSSEVRGLVFDRILHLPYFLCASKECSAETAGLCRLRLI